MSADASCMERQVRTVAIATTAIALALAIPAGASPARNLPRYRVPPRVTSSERMAAPLRTLPHYRVPPRSTRLPD